MSESGECSFCDEFLGDDDFEIRDWNDGAPPGVTLCCVFFGGGPMGQALEVACAEAESRPTAETVRRLWATRLDRRPIPLVVVVSYVHQDERRVSVCGPSGEKPPVLHDLDPDQVAGICRAGLEAHNHHRANEVLLSLLPEVGTDLPGVYNSGLFATQELRRGVPDRPDWEAATSAGRSVMSRPDSKGRKLIERLGFRVEDLPPNSHALVTSGARRAVAVFLEDTETFTQPLSRLEATSAISHALAVADEQGLAWVVLTRGKQVRLYSAKADVGVGRRGRAETFVEVNLSVLPADRAGFLTLLFGADALIEGGSVAEILGKSADFASDLAVRLRDRVYEDMVPALATAVARQISSADEPTDDDLDAAYEATLTILFRLLFVAYAEDRDLLPYRTNDEYRDHSLKRIAHRFSDAIAEDRLVFEEHTSDHWEDVFQLWRAVDEGQAAWGVPLYNGGLFTSQSEVGRTIASLDISDADFGPALKAMLVDEGPEGIGPVDFRALSVREFGTIYEGLLESNLSIAQTDLTLDKDANYVPAGDGDDIVVQAGEVYFHNRSGARKATGSYFTKPFAVEHLLDHALESALDTHLACVKELLDAGDEVAAGEKFFDFRCADLSMGSGHFLIAAVDRIEARLSNFLAVHPIAPVMAELDNLRDAAAEHLGELADPSSIETTSLLRRQIARRCIYGVDVNLIAVELARLALWVHTFVEGLPLSFLNHSLVWRNSLTGIGTLNEALSILDPDTAMEGEASLLKSQVLAFFDDARTHMRRLATITETTKADVDAARRAQEEATEALVPASQLFALLVGNRLDRCSRPERLDADAIANAPDLAAALDAVDQLQALHFPIAFPEVFIRDRPGFDCIIGNPPWEETTVEKLGFWALRFPGLKSMKSAGQKMEIARLEAERADLVQEYEAELVDAEQMRRSLIAGPYPGMGTGDPDLYKAFCWRFWQLSRDDGRIGVVLPRSALMAKGTTEWRQVILDAGQYVDVTMLLNNSQWFFPDVHPQYTIGLIGIRKAGGERTISLAGPYRSRHAYDSARKDPPAEFSVDEFRTWSPNASFPLIPSSESVEVYRKLRAHPRLDADDGWQCRPAAEFHATNDKKHMLFEPARPDDLWLVYKGASFNIWKADTGNHFGWADPDHVIPVLQDRRRSSHGRKRSPFSGYPREVIEDDSTLPCLRPRICFRDVARGTDTRTVIAALVPPDIVLTNKAPYLLWPQGDERDQAYLLGVLCSMPLDWCSRRVVEISLNFHLFNSFPIPRASRDDPMRLEVERLAGRLAAVDDRYSDWAATVGVEVGSVGEPEKPDLITRLDAAVAHVYGLDADDLRVIYETFHEGKDYSDRLAAVLEHFEDLG